MPALWLLGSSGFSAQVAGMLGLPFAFAHHFSSANTEPALELYRRSFRASAVLAEPYALIGVAVLCADDAEEAHRLHGSSRLSLLRAADRPAVHVAKSGRGVDLPVYGCGPGTHRLRHGVACRRRPGRGGGRANRLAAATGVDELMVTTNTFSHAARLRSYQLLAERAAPPQEPAAASARAPDA